MLTWRIHAGLADGRAEELSTVIESLGDRVQLISGHWRALPPPPSISAGELGGLALTTLQDASRLLREGWRAPRLLYFHEQRFNVSFWMPRIDARIPVLNRGCLFVPVGAISHSLTPLSALLGAAGNGVFVRPDSGLKLFPGVALKGGNLGLQSWGDVARHLENDIGPQRPESLACISPLRKLDRLEWRFWIVDRKVVASTPYSWDREPISWREAPEDAASVALAMAANAWQPDVAYVADVVQCLDSGEWHLNELNAASTSGLYAVPFEPLVAALREAVIAEADGALCVED